MSCSKRHSSGKRTNNIELENDWVTANTSSIVTFDNPGYNEDPMYDSIQDTSGSLTPRQEHVNRRGSLDNSNTTHEAPENTCMGMSNPMYGVSFSKDLPIEDSEKRYASIQQKKTEP